MLGGTAVTHVDHTDYREIAHHSELERSESLDVLDGIDREVAEDAPRLFRFMLLADRDQSLGAIFMRRYVVRGRRLRE